MRNLSAFLLLRHPVSSGNISNALTVKTFIPSMMREAEVGVRLEETALSLFGMWPSQTQSLRSTWLITLTSHLATVHRQDSSITALSTDYTLQ